MELCPDNKKTRTNSMSALHSIGKYLKTLHGDNIKEQQFHEEIQIQLEKGNIELEEASRYINTVQND
jgi:hypothetical protein